MSRPYISSSIKKLEELFQQRKGSRETVLRDLLQELRYRKTKRARRLLERVTKKLTKHASDDSERTCQDEDDPDLFHEPSSKPGLTDDSAQSRAGPHYGESESVADSDSNLPPDDVKRPDRLQRMRPPGTSGLPDPWIRKLDQSLELSVGRDADRLDVYIEALGELIMEIRRTGAGQRRYELEHGQRVDAASREKLYSFAFTDEADLFEDAKIEIEILGQRVEGSVVSITAGKLVLTLTSDMGEVIKHAILLIDATALLEALKDKLEKVKAGGLSINRQLADAVIGYGEPLPNPEPIPTSDETRLNVAQRNAHRRALTETLSYIWGPPGTGKTMTLGAIVRSAFEGGKRVLVCSNTNKAVDQILFHVCKVLDVDHPAMVEGKVVRLGRIADDKLAARYSAFITVDGIVERRSAELQKRKSEIEDEIARIDVRTERSRHVLERFEALDIAESEVSKQKEATNRAAREEKERQTLLHRTLESVGVLEKELQERRTAVFGFFKRSEERIRRDISMMRSNLEELYKQVNVAKTSYAEARRCFEEAQAKRNKCRDAVKDFDRVTIEREIRKAEEMRAPLVSELREIDVKLAELRDSILREARILGSTCTKSYLSVAEVGQSDMVIIDEASMVPLPVIWFSSGLSRERVIICGDFRQIPPIVQTNQQAIFDVLGHDVFEEAGLNESPEHNKRLTMLNTQYRMKDAICSLIAAPMYQNLLSTAAERDERPAQHLPKPFDSVLTIVDTSDLWPFESVNAFFSRFNLLHALLVRNLAWFLHEKGNLSGSSDLGVCTPYAAQAKLIQKLLEGESLDSLTQVGTVHRFQGDERRTIVLDIPESHGGARMLGQFVQGVPPEHVGARLMNVAISRAEDHLIVLANLTYLDRLLPSSSLLRSALYEMQQNGQVIPGKDLLALRPIESDLRGLLGRFELDIEAKTFGLFDETSFDAAVMSDIVNSAKSIVIFSGFVTPRRVSEIGEALRWEIAKGVKVRCVTRPPHLNGSMDPTLGKEALDMLESIGCIVDCRAKIHQKIVLIDSEIVWHGSLNVLSHSHRTEESMTRVVNAGLAQGVAAAMAKRRLSAEKAAGVIAEAENPRCALCNSRTVYDESRFGPYFYCESKCGWRQNLNLKSAEQSSRGRSRTDQESSFPQDGPPCPKCGKTTKLRRGSFGVFYGCEDYPSCRGTINPDPSRGGNSRPKRRRKRR